FFFFQAEDGIRDFHVTGVQTCALPILSRLPNTRSLQRPDRVMEQPEANFILPASISSKVQSCSTSEYITRSSKGELIRPHITALAMLPMPACRGPRLLGRRPASTSRLKKAIRWSAMPWVSSSGGVTVE